MNTNYAKIAKNKSLLKEYSTSESSRTVYLKDGDEFQIQLFNPETTEICARIWIEDIQLSHDIVLRPGERLWLERYTDRSKKFKFETYVVDGRSAQVKDAISHNGDLKIEFYRRKKQPQVTWYDYNYINVNPNPWKPYDVYYSTCDCNLTTQASSINNADSCLSFSVSGDGCNTSVTTGNANGTSFATSARTLGKTAMPSASSVTTVSTDASNYTCFTSSISTVEPKEKSAAYNNDWYKDKKDLETGRVSDGGYSKQKFNTVDMEFEYWAFRTERIKILPESRKPYTSNDLKKVYCTNCGRKLKDKYKFCPYCGQKLD